MTTQLLHQSGSTATSASSSATPFDPFHVRTWTFFIEQDDPRMISFDLRKELEAAYDIHAFSPRCLQNILQSLLLWAELAREQRHHVAWATDRNIALGQNLVQHALDMTAEVSGVNTDDIYASLQAEQHPFLKKLREVRQSRALGRREGAEGRPRTAMAPTLESAADAITPLPTSLSGCQTPSAPRTAGEVAVEGAAVAAIPRTPSPQTAEVRHSAATTATAAVSVSEETADAADTTASTSAQSPEVCPRASSNRSDDVVSAITREDASDVAVSLAAEAELAKFCAGGTHDLLQAFWNDRPTDPDGVTVWFERALAVTEADRRLPLHVEGVAPLSTAKVRARMQAKVAQRWDRLVEYLGHRTEAPLPPHRDSAALLSAADIAALHGAGLLRPASIGSGADTVVAFSVVDRAELPPSRRFLAWPRGSNQRTLEDGYEPNVPLCHISAYLDAVNAPAGCVAALRAGFDQIALPEEVQECFVFTDAANRRWCLTRLPMGHAVATEMLHLVLSTLCGHPSYALPQYAAAPTVHAEVWVRTMRYWGLEKDVQESRERFRLACRECGAAVEPCADEADTQSYTFLGVRFHHALHSVSVAPDMLRRIAVPQREVSTRQLERQFAQLLFCAAVLHVAASSFFHLHRAVSQRLLSAAGREELLDTPTALPADAFADVVAWYAAVKKNTSRRVVTELPPRMTAFVEVAATSWWAVLISEETQERWCTDGLLEDARGTYRACRAVATALECFLPCIEDGAHVTIFIVGGDLTTDNDRRLCENEPASIVAECARTHLMTHNFSFDVHYAGAASGETGREISALAVASEAPQAIVSS